MSKILNVYKNTSTMECDTEKNLESSNYDGYIKEMLSIGGLTATKLKLVGSPILTDNIFAGCYIEAKDGEPYEDEWVCDAVDPWGDKYQIYWRFTLVRGEEPENEDELPFTEENIHRIELSEVKAF